ncbi:putative gas vesicle synthesis protein GvpK [Bradyrhizobium oligotrophicum S58]|uniref:Putative gas vesicle synthesis protein GvpK n=1 Tax=Bradyrhizobium oligotrophicum S58 TaxID=1245469 RepID=M4Z369_9BRAD|nr:gas vesicle protein K [Bradyrhizobium oligotrophicum]BAM87509.1 putative gas vesicle synthesis protein GvpK [Bradyrhizobium oligotrophicum S58]
MSASSHSEAPGLRLQLGDLDTALAAVFTDAAPNGSINLDPDKIEHDLARLVLTLIEFLRRLLELQAIRRMEANELSEDEEERVGLALMRAAAQVSRLARELGVDPRELNLQLGPLGRLL